MSDYFKKLKSKLEETSHPTDNQGEVSNEKDPVLRPTPQATTSAVKRAPITPEGNIEKPGKKYDKKFIYSQTIIKAITNQHGDYKEVCPRRIHELYITKNYRYLTKAMLEGVFGETLLLGSGAKGQKVTDLPKHKKTGEKLKYQKNIEEQALRFPMWCTEKGISIIPGYNIQLPVVKRIDDKGDKRIFGTEFDIFPTPFMINGEYKMAVVDIKFTADVNQTFGDFCWGEPHRVDYIQADSAYWLLQNFDMDLNIEYNPEKEDVYRTIFGNSSMRTIIDNIDFVFIYFIIGYKKEPLNIQCEFLKRDYKESNGSLIRQLEFKERLRKTIAQLNEWDAKQWPAEDGLWCKDCPVNKLNGGYCTQAPLVKTV